jgi:hypothetical protein
LTVFALLFIFVFIFIDFMLHSVYQSNYLNSCTVIYLVFIILFLTSIWCLILFNFIISWCIFIRLYYHHIYIIILKEIGCVQLLSPFII